MPGSAGNRNHSFRPERPRGLLEPCAGMTGTHGSEGASALQGAGATRHCCIAWRRTHASFDDPNLVSHGGLVPVMALAQRAGLGDLVAEHVRPGGECGVNAQVKDRYLTVTRGQPASQLRAHGSPGRQPIPKLTVPDFHCLRRGLGLKDGPGSARTSTVSVGLGCESSSSRHRPGQVLADLARYPEGGRRREDEPPGDGVARSRQ